MKYTIKPSTHVTCDKCRRVVKRGKVTVEVEPGENLRVYCRKCRRQR